MKKDQTPQQPDPMFNGETKGVYAVNEQGEYELTRTSGWQPETDALNLALAEIERLTTDALVRAKAGETSPLEFHMYRRRLDVPMLAKAMGKFQWQVRRHFKPKVFAQLDAKIWQAYADVLGIRVETLLQLCDGD